ncbi:hypothetical protein [Microbaculum marinum]|uniref:Uncharacterized protein n=1 Tax=Microbaculum marinum TaxID=1764581 RepID=A0AAW9S0R4_9HYPH
MAETTEVPDRLVARFDDTAACSFAEVSPHELAEYKEWTDQSKWSAVDLIAIWIFARLSRVGQEPFKAVLMATVVAGSAATRPENEWMFYDAADDVVSFGTPGTDGSDDLAVKVWETMLAGGKCFRVGMVCKQMLALADDVERLHVVTADGARPYSEAMRDDD